MLLKLRATSIPININKYKFHIKEVKYLSLILILGGLKIDPAKVEAI